jgi:hypothetical protein
MKFKDMFKKASYLYKIKPLPVVQDPEFIMQHVKHSDGSFKPVVSNQFEYFNGKIIDLGMQLEKINQQLSMVSAKSGIENGEKFKILISNHLEEIFKEDKFSRSSLGTVIRDALAAKLNEKINDGLFALGRDILNLNIKFNKLQEPVNEKAPSQSFARRITENYSKGFRELKNTLIVKQKELEKRTESLEFIAGCKSSDSVQTHFRADASLKDLKKDFEYFKADIFTRSFPEIEKEIRRIGSENENINRKAANFKEEFEDFRNQVLTRCFLNIEKKITETNLRVAKLESEVSAITKYFNITYKNGKYIPSTPKKEKK